MTGSKAQLRARLRHSRREVDEGRVQMLLMEHPWVQAANTIMAYSVIPPEIDLTPVLEWVLNRGKRLLLPRCEKDGTMTARDIKDLQQRHPGAFGILEPEGEIVAPEAIDLILVPGLAFDPTGGRLGRGKGYYDRFLPQTGGKTMGICRELLERVPVEAHDIKMDAVVTDETVIICEMEDSYAETEAGAGRSGRTALL